MKKLTFALAVLFVGAISFTSCGNKADAPAAGEGTDSGEVVIDPVAGADSAAATAEGAAGVVGDAVETAGNAAGEAQPIWWQSRKFQTV